MKSKLPILIIAIVLILAIAMGGIWFYKSRQPSFITMTGAPGAEPAHILGPQRPRLTIEEFGDFQCPPCGRLHPLLKEVENTYGDRVAIIFREYPMTQLHANALEAARAAEAAGLQGHFWEMHDFIYDTQQMWSNWSDARSVFARQATIMGMDPARLRRDMDSAEVQKRIETDQRRGRSLGVQGTPTVFLNGKLISNDDLEKLPDVVKGTLAQNGS